MSNNYTAATETLQSISRILGGIGCNLLSFDQHGMVSLASSSSLWSVLHAVAVVGVVAPDSTPLPFAAPFPILLFSMS